MNYRNLYLTFFDSSRATDAEPFIYKEVIPYKEKTIQEYVDIGISDSLCLDIQNKTIQFEDFKVKINSRFISYSNGFTIELEVNEITFQNSTNLYNAGFSGTILLNKEKGFHYALIQ